MLGVVWKSCADVFQNCHICTTCVIISKDNSKSHNSFPRDWLFVLLATFYNSTPCGTRYYISDNMKYRGGYNTWENTEINALRAYRLHFCRRQSRILSAANSVCTLNVWKFEFVDRDCDLVSKGTPWLCLQAKTWHTKRNEFRSFVCRLTTSAKTGHKRQKRAWWIQDVKIIQNLMFWKNVNTSETVP